MNTGPVGCALHGPDPVAMFCRMARIRELDFAGYVEAKKAGRARDDDGRDDAHAYAYVSDRKTRETFESLKAVEHVVTHAVRLMRGIGKNELLGTAVKVSHNQFPRVHDLGLRCAETLCIVEPTIYVRSNPTLNAKTYGTNDDSFILLHSALVDHLTDAELLSIIGHECGHIHNNHVVYLTALHYLRTLAALFLRWAAAPAMLALNSWVRRAEITCDRAGLLCSRDLEVSTRALAKLALGSTKLYDEFNLDAYLAQYDEAREGIGKLTEMTASHPWLPKRVKALREFGESALYREHIGERGGRSMSEVDARVHTIVKVLG